MILSRPRPRGNGFPVVVTDADRAWARLGSGPGLLDPGEYGLHLAPLPPRGRFEAAAILAAHVKVDAALLDRAEGVRVVGRFGAGLDSIDLVASRARGIAVVNRAGDYCAEEVATYVLGAILHFARGLGSLDRQARRLRTWRSFAGIEGAPRLSGQTLGVVGCGVIGQAVAKTALPFFGRVLCCPMQGPRPLRVGVPATFDEVLADADYLALHVRLTPETRHLISWPELAAMKRGAVLLNASRGSVVDFEALAWHLRRGRLAGAALDVVEREHLGRRHPLARQPNVLLTMHSAFYSAESFDDLRRSVLSEVASILSSGAAESPKSPFG
jgi:D-3-phosphoglycerate dehydrogenase